MATSTTASDEFLRVRSNALYEDSRRELHQKIDRLFAALLFAQWLAGLGVAFWISPLTWSGRISEVHPHVWTALSLGSLITFFPVALAFASSGAAITRHTIGVAQMLWSALLIHLTGGRIETHFHVFGSLAFLAFYRDWKVILTATVVVAADHVLRGYLWPESVYGVVWKSEWRWVEHAGWVVFEDAFLIRSCVRGVQEMRQVAGRQAETEASAEKNYEVLVHSIDGVVWEAEAGTFRYRYVSPQVTRLLGCTPEEWLADPNSWKSRIHPDDRHRILIEAVGRSLREEHYELEYRMVDRAGRTVWVRDAVTVHLEPGGATVLRGILTDITARKRQEEQLLRSERRFRTVVEQAADILFVHDLDGRILDANGQACASLGYTREELLARNVCDVEKSVPKEHLLQAWRELAPGKPVTAEGNATRKDGSVFPVEVRVGLLESEGDKMVIALVRDITERRRLDRMKNEFISTVSHELRTPLTSIRGALGLVASGVVGDLSTRAKPMVEIAAKNCERLVNLVSDILDIEKIASGQMVFKLRPLSMRPFLQQAVEANRGYAVTAGVTLKFEPGDVQATVLADGDRLMQVLANLISNACKYSPRGESVVVSLSRIAGTVRVAVRDRGPGLSEEFKARIFQKFAQADTSDGSQRKGTGLGLAISKALVERMSGTIGFESELGSGSTFFFDLPEDKPAVRTSPASSRPRLLVCEDEGDIAEILRRMLDREGFDADIAGSLKDARELLATNVYVGMTLDLSLPDGSGIALLKELRRNPATAQLPVIVISANLDENRPALNGHAFNLVDWLEKPIPDDRLRTALQRSCPSSAGRRARVLHVEDDPDITRVVGELLCGVAEVVHADRVLDAWEKLRQEDFDLLIVDIGLPDGSGLELLPALKRSTQTPIPALVFSAHEISPRTKNVVSAALLKSKTSNEELVGRVRALLGQRGTAKTAEAGI